MATLQWIGFSLLLTSSAVAGLCGGCSSADTDAPSSASGSGGGSEGSSGDMDAGPNPFDAAPTCSNMSSWTSGNLGSNQMDPGQPCVACHNLPPKPPELAPPLIIGGTVYRTGHEPDDCNGGPADPLDKAMIEITDANQKSYMLQVNTAGNFFWAVDQGSMPGPFKAKVIYQGRERAMGAAQNTGDCNSCHTQSGANGAPGRIVLP